jgi:hypothetical protein
VTRQSGPSALDTHRRGSVSAIALLSVVMTPQLKGIGMSENLKKRLDEIERRVGQATRSSIDEFWPKDFDPKMSFEENLIAKKLIPTRPETLTAGQAAKE